MDWYSECLMQVGIRVGINGEDRSLSQIDK